MFLFGLGLGNTMQPLTLAVQAVVDPRDMGMATSAATFFRQMGGTLGVAVFLSVLFNSVGDNIKNAFVAAAKDSSFVAALSDPAVLANPTNKAFVTALAAKDTSSFGNVLGDSSVIGALDPRLAHPFKVGFATSMDLVFLLGAIVCAAGLLVLERTGLEHRHVDLVDEQRRVQRIRDLGWVVAIGLRLGGRVDVLASVALVLLAGGVAAVDSGLLPALSVRLGLLADLLGPRQGEPGVEDATGSECAPDGVVEHRQRGDGRQRGWIGGRD